MEKFIEDIQRQSWPTKLNELTKGGETIGMFTHMLGEQESECLGCGFPVYWGNKNSGLSGLMFTQSGTGMGGRPRGQYGQITKEGSSQRGSSVK